MIINNSYLSKSTFYLHHMTFMQGTYLRILTPETINGVYPKMGPDGRQLFKETHLPLSARPFMVQLNKRLPEALKKKIEVVDSAPVSNGYKTIEPDEADKLRAKIAELEAQNAQLKQPPVAGSVLFDEGPVETSKPAAKK